MRRVLTVKQVYSWAVWAHELCFWTMFGQRLAGFGYIELWKCCIGTLLMRDLGYLGDGLNEKVRLMVGLFGISELRFRGFLTNKNALLYDFHHIRYVHQYSNPKPLTLRPITKITAPPLLLHLPVSSSTVGKSSASGLSYFTRCMRNVSLLYLPFNVWKPSPKPSSVRTVPFSITLRLVCNIRGSWIVPQYFEPYFQ